MYRSELKQRQIRASSHEDADTIDCMSALAVALRNQGEYELAEEMHRAVLELRERVLGPKDPSTVETIGDLAEVLRVQGKYKAAKEMYNKIPRG